MRVLVTGANGFVGRAIVAELLQKNHEVFCLVSPKSEENNSLTNVLRADISASESLSRLENTQNIDVIIHSAGLAHQFGKTSDEDFWKVNVRGTENVANLAAKLQVKHFILISSVAVYGTGRDKLESVDETTFCQPQSVYARSKFESENAAIEICEKNKIALTILRLATVIGEDDRGNTARLVDAIDRKRFVWIGNGENRKSLIYKSDAAAACLKVLAKKTPETEIFNITGEPVRMSFIVSEIAEVLGKKIPKLSVSVPLLEKIFRANAKTAKLGKITKLSETVEKWISEDIFSGEKIAEVYGFRAATTVSEAIRREVEAYKVKKVKK